MTDHVEISFKKFDDCSTRAKSLCGLHQYLNSSHQTKLIDYDDLLRSSIILVVSAFDYLVHEIFHRECLHRIEGGKIEPSFHVPLSLGPDLLNRKKELSNFIVATNSYKSFVAPDKFAAIVRVLVDKPWEKMATELKVSEQEAKSRLRDIVDWRNRLAHQADINPNYGGSELYPICRLDTEEAISDMIEYGKALCTVIRTSR
ncbi:HEPN domain-containing protein [Fulvimarina pelagi]|uniref:HEPN domain-containing protein n=1 Tax=Fulvimarina pelagi TaxID=217511 RepID=UPI0011D0D399|nr:HEPN domain-containing protein [Fulvimarina pelagi]